MKVNIENSLHEVNRPMYRNMLKVAKKQVKPIGVYAVERDGMVIFLNKKAPNKSVLMKQVKKYEDNGFKVYYNG